MLSAYSLITQWEQGLHLQPGYEPDGHSYCIRIDRKGVAAHPRECPEFVSIITKKHFVYFYIPCLRLHCSVGAESVGSSNMCKTNEAKRAHGQREVVAAKSRRHPGLFSKNGRWWQLAKNIWNVNLLSSAVPVGQLRRDYPSVVSRTAKVHRHLPGSR